MSGAEGHRRVQPAFQALTPGPVRRIGIDAQDKVLPSMVTENPAPIATAAWQMALAYRALGDLMESSDPDKVVAAGEDVVTRLQSALEAVHRHLGEKVSAGLLAERSFERQMDRLDTGEAVIGAVTVEVVLPDGEHSATVHLGQERRGAPVQIRGDVKAANSAALRTSTSRPRWRAWRGRSRRTSRRRRPAPSDRPPTLPASGLVT
ncbi:hypothetical protein ACFQ0T_43125 [Kitasatospora gansuensis]